MSSAATSTSVLRRALLCAAIAAAAAAALFAGAAGAAGLAACTVSVSVPTATPSTVKAGTTIAYSAGVTASAGCANGSPVGTLSFYSNYLVNGQPQRFQIGSAVAVSGGTATLYDNSLPPGTFTVTAVFTSADTSQFTNSGSPSGTSVVIESNAPNPTTMTFTEDPTSLVVGQTVTFHVHITPVDANGDPLGTVPTGSVEFSAGPTAAPSAQFHFWSQQLDGTGSVTFSYNGFVAGDYVVIASYTGDPTDQGIYGRLPLTVLPGASSIVATPTQTSYTGDTEAAYGSTATLTGHLALAGGSPLSGEPLTLTLGSQSCTTPPTTGTGNASCTVSVTQAPGSYQATAAFAGDSDWAASSGSGPFTVTAPTTPPATTTAAAAVAPVLAGTPATLSATVTPAAATGTVTFASGGATLCTATLSAGAASCAAAFPSSGSYVVTATYGGDRVYPGSSGTTTVLVYGLAPGGGTFVVGDRSDAGPVTFWGSQWWRANVLSGGAAPSAFKGFALVLSAPRCGAAWSTDPGYSSPPPAGPLPAYMAVVVTSATAKSGAQISGRVAAIVIVKTDAGYSGDPGHAGTGVVVTTLCGG